MNEIYNFKSKKYEYAIKELKSALCDVVVMEEGQLAILEKTLDNKIDSIEKQALQLQIKQKSQLLDSTVCSISELINNIEKLDANYVDISKLNTKYLGKVASATSDKQVNTLITKDLNSIKTENQQILESIKDGIQEKEIIPDDTALLLPDINEAVANTTSIAESSLKEMQQPNLDQQDLISETPELESVNHQLEMLSEQEETVKNNAGANPLKKQLAIIKFKKTSKTVTKAILVRKEQLENLATSKIKQRKIMDLKHVFDGMTEFQATQEALAKKENAIKEEINNSIAEGLTGEKNIDKERQIEDLMVKANVYYNAGETQQAQELYDQISKLNNSIKKIDKGDVLIKKSA